MQFATADRVRETTITTGTGTIDLDGAVSNYQTFVAGVGTGGVVTYCIVHRGASEWEIGYGTITDASPDTLSRDYVSSSSTGSLVSFSSGTKDVFITHSSEFVATKDSNNRWLTPDGTIPLPAIGPSARPDDGLSFAANYITFSLSGTQVVSIDEVVPGIPYLTVGIGTPIAGIVQTGQFVSWVGTGTIPLDVQSTTICPNLNVDKVDDCDVDTDGTLAANSDTKIPSQKAVKTYADALIAANDAMVFKGVLNCSANPNYPAADRGHTYKVSVAGKIGGASGPNVEVGDTLLCITDSTASGDQAAVGSEWNVVQVNLDGAVIGPASSTDGNLATFNGTTGKLIQDGGVVTTAAKTVLDDASVAAMVDTLGGAASTGTGGLVRATSPTLVTPVLGTPSSGTLTNCTFPTLNQNTTGSSASCTGNSATVTTNANLTGPITSVGNATSIASQTGTGTKFVVDTSPTLVTPVLGVATATSLACATHTSSGAIGLTPATGLNLNVTLSGTGDFIVNTTQLVVDTSANRVGIGKVPTTATLDVAGNVMIPNNSRYMSKEAGGTERSILMINGSDQVEMRAATGGWKYSSTGGFSLTSLSDAGLFLIQNTTTTTGITKLEVKGGAGQGTQHIFMVRNASNGSLFTIAYSGKAIFMPATTSAASMYISAGTAPTSPSNQDMWSDGSDLFMRLGGTTYKFDKTAV